MKQRTRIYYSAEQRTDIWNRWQRGESMRSIGRLFERESSSIYSILQPSGGICPRTRTRSRFALSLLEREEVSRGVASHQSIRCIALRLKRSPSTISREIKRNGGSDGYRASAADQAAWDRAHRPKQCKLAQYRSLAKVVAAKLKQQWSPQQIAGWLKRQHPDREHERVSHETIYRSLYIQARGVLKKELQACLRTKRAIRRSGSSSLKRQGLGKITHAVSIRERPAAVEDRAVPGHWEGDLIGGINIYGDVGRTPVTICDVGQNKKEGCGHRGGGSHSTCSAPPHRAVSILDLGPRHRDGESSPLHPRNRYCCVLL